MSLFHSVSLYITREIPRCGPLSLHSHLIKQNQHTSLLILARFKSAFVRPPVPKPPESKSINRTVPDRYAPKIGFISSPGSRATQPLLQETKDVSFPVSKSEEVELTIDANEQAIQERIAIQRRKLLWPGIWTLFALVGTYGTLAYLDVKVGNPFPADDHLPERASAQLPQTWYLTPTVIREGTKAFWNDLDNLTIGIAVSTFAIHLLKRSLLPIWKNLLHITGERKWTAFTYILVHSSWAHAAANMAALTWFLPSVVRYFDGDLFHTAAFLVSVPLVTSYLTHFVYRLNLASGIVMNMGASGAIVAAFGIYCVEYGKEKMWAPNGIVVRLDAMYWGALFVAEQAWRMVQVPKGGNRQAYLVHLASLGLGTAYAYFDLKHHLWIPLVSEISSTQ